MSTKRIFISVIIPSYNYEKYLKYTVRSVLQQTWKNFEIIIIDDGSSDKSLDIAKQFANEHTNIKVLQHNDKKNHGLAETIKLGLKVSNGDYIAFLESDDLWAPDCLMRRVDAALTTDAGVIFNNIEPLIMEGANANRFYTYVPRIMKKHENLAQKNNSTYGPYEMKWDFWIENQIPTFSCVMIKKSIVEKCNFATPVPQWLDRWLWNQVAQDTNFAFISEKLTFWRIHKKSFNSRRTVSIKNEFITAFKFWHQSKKILRKRKDCSLLYLIFIQISVFIELYYRLYIQVNHIGLKKTIRKILGFT